MVAGGVSIHIKAKKAKGVLTKNVLGVRAAIIQQMHQFNSDAIRVLGKYPPPNSSYRRSGDLGRHWAAKVEVFPALVRGRVINSVTYAVFVQGPTKGAKGERQTAVMAAKGWPSVTTVLADTWRKHKREFSKILLESGKKAVT